MGSPLAPVLANLFMEQVDAQFDPLVEARDHAMPVSVVENSGSR